MALNQSAPLIKPKPSAKRRFFTRVLPLVVGTALLWNVCSTKWPRDKNAGTKEAIAAATEKAGKIQLTAPDNCTKKAEIYFRAGMDEEAKQVVDDCNAIYLGMNLPKVRVTSIDVQNPLGHLILNRPPGGWNMKGTAWWGAPITICLNAGFKEKLGDVYMARGQYGRAAGAYHSAGAEAKAESARRQARLEMESERQRQ
jgi:hypothetical protein